MKEADTDEQLAELSHQLNKKFNYEDKVKCDIFKSLLVSLNLEGDEMIKLTDHHDKNLVLYKFDNLLYNLTCYNIKEIEILNSSSCFKDIPILINANVTAFLTKNGTK